MEDRRRSLRLDFPLAIAYYPQDKVTQFSYTISKNICKTGICIPAVSRIAHDGDVIKMEIDLDGKECISATGKVRWVKMIDRKSPPDEEAGIELINDEEVGVEFIDIDPADIDKLTNTQKQPHRTTLFGF